MDRASSKHGPRLDDQMERETLGLVRGSPADARAEEWREPEPPGEDELVVSARPLPDRRPVTDADLVMTDDDREMRSRLGVFLPRSVLPADREALIAAARRANAPDHIIDELGGLPAGQRFETVARVWAALGHPMDQRF